MTTPVFETDLREWVLREAQLAVGDAFHDHLDLTHVEWAWDSLVQAYRS
jgi:hypothetical protein